MDEIRTMTLEEIEERRKAIAEEIPTADAERLTAINAELDAIEERKKEIKTQAEERAKTVEEVLEMPAAAPIIEERKEKTMTDREYRNTPEYIDAYAEYVKAGFDVNKLEQRSAATLLSENGGGIIAVPTYVEDRINTAWENNEIMRRVRRTYLAGNVKVGVEVSSSGAVIHEEGGLPIEPEELIIEYVNLVGEYVKKLVEVSHTVLDLRGSAFLNYLYDEVEYQIVKKCADEVLSKIMHSTHHTEIQGTGTDNAPTTADIINAQGYLAGDANPVLVISRANAAALKAAALSANYGYDPFDGLEVIYTDNPNFGAMVVDLSAVQVNYPDGDQPKFIFDEYTKADENIVRIVGRLNMAADLVRTGAAVAIVSGGGQ